MARPPEHSPSDGTAPQADLNPLLNPILAQNMGRWAEVYFTTPPELREQAVQALIEELQAKQDQTREEIDMRSEPGENASPTSSPIDFSNEPAALDQTASAKSVCQSCGEANPEGQRFCGMCGAPLENFFAEADTHGSDAAAGEWDSFHSASPNRRDPEAIPSQPAQPVEMVRQEPMPIFSAYAPKPTVASDYDARQWAGEPESSYQGGDDFHTLSAEYGSVPYRYRVYIGVTLAALMGVLGYMGWRATHAFPNGHVLPSAPTVAQTAPAQSTQQNPAPAPPPAGAAPSSATNPESRIPNTGNTADNSAVTPRTASRPAAVPRAKNPERVAERRQSADRSSNQAILRRAASSQPAAAATSASSGNGSEELSIAETFLNGTNGHARDTSEAAKWLWQAVSKQNAPATLMLADLYLRGDGVAKNCDQGRVLLDAAARKGVVGAGERLRNLAAFGCQ